MQAPIRPGDELVTGDVNTVASQLPFTLDELQQLAVEAIARA
jgi:hypothetical protein